MTEPHLTVAEFERWADKIDKKLDAFIEVRVETEQRLTVLETTQASTGKIAAWVSGIVAAIIVSLATGLISLFGGHR